jgi:uncharacterized protein
MNTPLIKKFSTQTKNYIYDTNTNQIFEVDDLVYELIDSTADGASDELVKKLGTQYTPNAVTQALEEINEMKSKGYFSSSRPSGMELWVSKEELRACSESQILQLILNVTESCNMRCRYCAYSSHYPYKRTHTTRQMTWETAKAALDFFFVHNGAVERPAISFYGGEPLINFKLIQQCVDYANARGDGKRVRYSLTTNGTLLNEKIIRFLAEHDVSLLVSLNGPQEINDRFRVSMRERGTYECVVRNLLKMKELHQSYFNRKVSLSIVLTPPYDFRLLSNFFDSDHEFIPDTRNPFIVSTIERIDTDLFDDPIFRYDPQLHEETLNNVEQAYVQELIKESPEKMKFTMALFERSLLMLKRRKSRIRLTETIGPNGMCVPGLRKLFVNVDGDFRICEKVSDLPSIGNIRDGFDFDRIFRMLDDYISISSECCNCWAVRLCQMCFYGARHCGKLNAEGKRISCEQEKARILRALVRFCSILEENEHALDYMHNFVLEME